MHARTPPERAGIDRLTLAWSNFVCYWLFGLPPRPPSWKAHGRMLHIRILGRPVHPYALAVSLATTVSIWSVSTALAELDAAIRDAEV